MCILMLNAQGSVFVQLVFKNYKHKHKHTHHQNENFNWAFSIFQLDLKNAETFLKIHLHYN